MRHQNTMGYKILSVSLIICNIMFINCHVLSSTHLHCRTADSYCNRSHCWRLSWTGASSLRIRLQKKVSKVNREPRCHGANLFLSKTL